MIWDQRQVNRNVEVRLLHFPRYSDAVVGENILFEHSLHPLSDLAGRPPVLRGKSIARRSALQFLTR